MTTSSPRRRVLLIEPRIRYHNPTYECFTRAMDRAFEVVRYGPGYGRLEDLKEDLPGILSDSTPVCAVFLNRHFMLHTFAGARSSLHCDFDAERFLELKPDFLREIAPIDVPLFGLVISLDGYKMTEERQQLLERFPGLIVANDPKSVPPPSTLPGLDEERFLRNGYNDRWPDFVAANQARMVPTGHTLSVDEFSSSSLRRRRHEICVPGAQYARRKRAIAALEAAGHEPVIRPALQLHAAPVFKVLGVDMKTSSVGIRFFNWTFRRLLASSRVSYTDGSMLQRPIRKFFEIPAAGSLLACTPNPGIECRGFVAGKHFVAAEPEELPQVLQWVRANPDAAQTMARAAQQLVRERHTVEPRARQLSRMLEVVLAGEFRGAAWNDGDLEFL